MSLRHFLIYGVGRLFSDKAWIRLKYWQWFRKFPNLKDPKTFNEKLQWLKLYDRQPIYTTMVDKFASKAFVAERIGAEYVVPALGGPWASFDEIDFDALPDQFVLKTNHDCGGDLPRQGDLRQGKGEKTFGRPSEAELLPDMPRMAL